MEPVIWLGLLAVVCVFLAPVLLFRPLLLAVANRISGKHTDAAALKSVQQRMTLLEQQIEHMQVRLSSVEEHGEFSRRLLEDLSRNSESGAAKSKESP